MIPNQDSLNLHSAVLKILIQDSALVSCRMMALVWPTMLWNTVLIWFFSFPPSPHRLLQPSHHKLLADEKHEQFLEQLNTISDTRVFGTTRAFGTRRSPKEEDEL